MKFFLAIGAAEAASLLLPARRRLALVPVGAQRVVLLSLVRIAKNFVRFVDLLETFFGFLFVLRHIRMVLARQFAKGFPNFILARAARYPETLVIILKFHWHSTASSLRYNTMNSNFCQYTRSWESSMFAAKPRS